jgi:large subunit ribosomal protein L4
MIKRMNVPLYNLAGKEVGKTMLSDEIFKREWNPDLVRQVVLAQAANRRKPIAHTKTRGEVRGGGRKPWRQKGTGRARHGSIRSPIWKGGGVTHGPRNEKIYALSINKKMKRAAVHSALSKKLADGELKIIDSMALASPKTKELALALSRLLVHPRKTKSLSSLLVPVPDNKAMHRASANIPMVKTVHPSSLNTEDLMKYRNIFIEERALADIR